MEINQILLIIGLIMDATGILVWFYSGALFKIKLPEPYGSEITEEELKKNKGRINWAYVGLSLLLFGFILQILGASFKI